MKSNKKLVCLLIFLLSATSFLTLFMPTKADTLIVNPLTPTHPTFITNQTSTIQATTTDGANVTLKIFGNVTATQISNIWFENLPDHYNNTNIDFTVTGQNGTLGFVNMTFPKSSLLGGTAPVVAVDGRPAENQGFSKDAQNFYVWFTVFFNAESFGRSQVEILFLLEPTHRQNQQVPIQSYLTVIIIVAIVAMVAILILRQKRKVNKQGHQVT